MLPRLIDFGPQEEEMVTQSLAALNAAGYDCDLLTEIIRVDMPAGTRGMSLANGAALGAEAFISQECLNFVLEEELLHLTQKVNGLAEEFGPSTALELERDVHDRRRFPAPHS